MTLRNYIMRQEQKNFKYTIPSKHRRRKRKKMKEMKTSYDEISKLIDATTTLGIHVIEEGQRHTEKALTVIITKRKSVKEMMPCRWLKDDEVISGRSPFTWKLSEEEFIDWARVATSQPFAMFNKSIAKLVRDMDVESFEALRKHENLEDEMYSFLQEELVYSGLGRIKFTHGALVHLSLIYGGLLHREKGVELFIEQLMNMTLQQQFIPDRCRSCMNCKYTNKGTGRYCRSLLNEGFVIPSDINVSELVDSFPDIKIKEYRRYRTALTRYIPGDIKDCEFYIRRK